jgi:hypothetical protein
VEYGYCCSGGNDQNLSEKTKVLKLRGTNKATV